MSPKKTNEMPAAIHARQIRAARALLGWSQADLEKKSKVSRATIKRMEGEDGAITKATAANVARIVEVCEAKGVCFLSTETGGLGVMWEKPVKKDAVAAEEPVTDETPQNAKAKAVKPKDKRQKKAASPESEEAAPAIEPQAAEADSV